MANTPEQIITLIDSTIRNKTLSNSITVIQHADLLSAMTETLSADTKLNIITSTGSTYDLTSVDFPATSDTLIRHTPNSTLTVTITTASTSSIIVGKSVSVNQAGTQQITISGGTGITLQSAVPTTKTRTQFSTVNILKVDTNTWLLNGDLALS